MTQNEILVILSLQTANALTNLNKFVDQAGASLRSLASNVAAAYVGIQGLMKLEEGISGALHLEEAVGRLEQRTGLALTTIGALKLAGDAVGFTFEDLSRSLTIFNAKVYEAATVGGAAAEMFNTTLKIGITNADGSLKTSDAILNSVIARFKELNIVQQDAVAKGLFGRGGFELIPLFDQLDEAVKRVQETGGPFKQDAVDKAGEFNTTMREAKENIQFVWVEVANNLLPTLQLLADYLQNVSRNTQNMSQAADVLGGIVKGLITIVVPLALAFYDLGKSFGVAAAVLVENFNVALNAAQLIAKQVITVIKDLVQNVTDMYDALATGIQAGNELLHGNVGTAKELIKGEMTDIADHIHKTASDASTAVVETTMTSLDAIGKMFKNADSIWGEFYGDLSKQWKSASDMISKMWSGTQTSAAPARSFAPGPQQPFFPVSSTDTKNLREMDGILTAIYQQQQKLIESDPFKTQVEKERDLIPLMQQQADILAKQYESQYNLYNNPNASDVEKTNALKEMVKLQGEMNDLQIKAGAIAASHGFANNFKTQAVQMANAWGDLGKSLADGSFKIIEQGINGMAQALTGLIMGTKTAGQAFAQFGIQMLTSFIEMILQAVLYAELAIPILTALGVLSGGATAAQGSAVTTAAVAGAVSTVGSIAGRELGGPVSAGVPYIVGEKRAEVFIPNTSGTIHPDASRFGGGGEQHFHILPVMDRGEAASYVMDHPDGHHIMVETLSKQKSKIIPRRF